MEIDTLDLIYHPQTRLGCPVLRTWSTRVGCASAHSHNNFIFALVMTCGIPAFGSLLAGERIQYRETRVVCGLGVLDTDTHALASNTCPSTRTFQPTPYNDESSRSLPSRLLKRWPCAADVSMREDTARISVGKKIIQRSTIPRVV